MLALVHLYSRDRVSESGKPCHRGREARVSAVNYSPRLFFCRICSPVMFDSQDGPQDRIVIGPHWHRDR